MSYLIIAIGLLLIVYAVYATVQKARGKAKSSCCGTPEAVMPKPVDDMDESHYPFKYNVAIDGMMCSNCATRVQNAINNEKGMWARVNLGRHRAKVLCKTEKTEEDFVRILKNTDYKVVGFEEVL